MAKFSNADNRRMYSWWWDSHISPKNSKWLKENLTDMDSKVKSMIKLIEEDADSFARRAEMYYKKRPELMKLVEEFYRAYRALAERYDHATGVIRHAHRTMAEAFPNQMPAMFADDSPVGSADSRTSDSSTPNREFTDDFESVGRRKSFTRFRDEFLPVDQARRELHFDEMEEKEDSTHSNRRKDHESEEIMALKESIAKLEAEKEAGLSQYQQSLDRLSDLEKEMAQIKGSFEVLSDQAKKAESEITILNKKLTEVEAEKESHLQNYQQSVEKISKLQEHAWELDKRAESANSEAQSLRSELEKLGLEKDAALNQYMQSLDVRSTLENKLQLTEEDSKKLKERAEKAESEIQVLRETVAKLTQEKETAAQRYQQCLDTIATLEEKLKIAQEEAKKLSFEVTSRDTKLKGAEEQFSLLEKSNQSLHMELEALMVKTGTQSHELTEKQKELGTLWARIQEERLRFVEAETAFQTLQQLHAQTQEELRVMASDLQHRVQNMKAMEAEKQSLQDEFSEIKKENKHLEQLNASFELSIKDMKEEMSSLVESKQKLKDELELRFDQKNALQQEIYCLKENLNDLNKKHIGIMDQVHAVGLTAESLESSVKELKSDNTRLQQTLQIESREKSALLSRLEILDQLFEKNSLLENSLADLNAELEAARGEIKRLEESFRSLLNEKSTILEEKSSLAVQLEETNRNFEKLSQHNAVLENSLSDVQNQLEVLMSKSNILEDSHQLLVNEKALLKIDNDGLSVQLEVIQGKLDDLMKLYGELEKRNFALEKEKEENLSNIGELQLSLEVERREHANDVYVSQTKFGELKTEMDHWQEECRRREAELDQMMGIALNNDIEILVLGITGQDLIERNHFLRSENVKLSEESLLLGRKISHLEANYLKQQDDNKVLIDQNRVLRAGNHQLLRAVDMAEDFCIDAKGEKDQVYIDQLLRRIQNMKQSLKKSDDEKIEASLEMIPLLTWIRQLVHMNEELRSELQEGDCFKETQLRQIEDLGLKLKDIQASFEEMQREKTELYAEKCSLTDEILGLEEKSSVLEVENDILSIEMLDLKTMSLIFRRLVDEGMFTIQNLMKDLTTLQDKNATLVGKLQLAEGRLQDVEIENLRQKEVLQKMDEEAKDFAFLKNQLYHEIESGKKMLQQAALELKLAEEKLVVVEEEKFESKRQVEDLSVLYNILKVNHNEQGNQILKLSTDACHLRIENELFHDVSGNLEGELQNKSEEINRLNDEIENGKKMLQQVGLQLKLVEEKLVVVEEEKCQSKRQVEGLSVLYNELKARHDEQGNQILKLSTDACHLSIENNLSHDVSLILEDELEKRYAEMKKLNDEIENGKKIIHEVGLELKLAEEKLVLVEKEKFESKKQVEGLNTLYNEVKMRQDEYENQLLKLSTGTCHLSIENDFLHDVSRKLEDELQSKSEEMNRLSDEIESGKNMLQKVALELKLAEEKLIVVEEEKFELKRQVEDLSTLYSELKVRQDEQGNQILKLSSETSHLSIENDFLHDVNLSLEDELENRSEEINKLNDEIESGKKMLQQMALELNLVEERLIVVEEEKLDSKRQVEDLSMLYNALKVNHNEQGNQILKLSTDTCHLSIENDFLHDVCRNLEDEMHNKDEEISKLDRGASSILRQFFHVMVTQLLYEQKCHELQEACLEFMYQNEALKTELASLAPDIEAMRECVWSLQNYTSTHMKLHHPKDEKLEDPDAAKSLDEVASSKNEKHMLQDPFMDLHGRLQVAVKTVMGINDNLIQESSDLRSKLDASNKQLELLQNEVQNMRPKSEITEADDALLTKDIVLDQASDGSNRHAVDENHVLKLWEISDPDPTLRTPKKKEVLGSFTEEELTLGMLETSKKSADLVHEVNNMKILQRLGSDVQKLVNLQLTVQDLKKKLNVTEKHQRGKAVIVCEALKGQLEEADTAILKLFDVNDKLMKNVDDRASFEIKSFSSFDFEGEDGGARRRKLSMQACRMSEKIGRLQLEVQRLQLDLLKLMDYQQGGKTKTSMRRILLRDYIYGRTRFKDKKALVCCLQPSTKE